MGAGSGLEGHAVHPGDLAQELLGGVQHFQGPWTVSHRLEGVELGEARLGRGLLVDPGLYFMVQEPRG